MANAGIGSRNSDVEILLIEPDPDHATNFTASIDDAIASGITVVSDASDAFDFVSGRNEYADAPRPDLILLDLEIGEGKGHDVLEEIKGDPSLRRIPVIVMTKSDDETDVVRSYERHANAYVHKPDDPDRFDELARSIENFWLTVAQLPPKED